MSKMGLEEAFEKQAPEDAKVINNYIDSIKEDKQQLEAKILEFHVKLSKLNTDHSLDTIFKLHTDTFDITNDRIKTNYIPDLD